MKSSQQFKHRLSILCSTLLLAACSHIDDYFLGKDNTPIPGKLPTFSKKVELVERWKIDLGERSGHMHEKLSPVLKGHHIYVATPKGVVQDRDSRSGKLHWKQVVNAGLSSGPTVSEGVVALGTQHASVVLLNRQTGHILWEKKVLGEVLAKPLIAAGEVVVKTVEGHLYAFDIKSGQRLWHWQHGATPLVLKASSSPILVQDHLVLVGFADGKLDAIDLKSGQLVWQKGVIYGQGASEVERLVDIDADPIVDGHLLLLASYQGFVGGLALENSELVWKHPASVYQNMCLDHGHLIVSDDAGVIWALNPTNGQVHWKQAHLKARDVTSPVGVSSGIVVADKTGYLHVLSVSEGALIGQTTLSGGVSMSPVARGNDVYVLTESGQLYAFHVKRIKG